MSKILELREKRARAWEAAKAFLDAKRTDDGFVSAEDAATYDRMETDVVNLGKEIERLERQAAIDAELAKPVNTPITNKPSGKIDGDAKTGRATDEYKKAFWNGMRNKLSYEVQNALSIGTDSEGGYLVPDEYERKLVEALEDEVFFRSLATVIKTSSGDRKIPIVTSKGEAAWIDEGGQFPESDDSFGQTSISAYKLATMIKVSDELLNDSVFNIEQYISREFGRRIGTKEEEAFFIGDGSGKPTGIFHTTGGADTGVIANNTSIYVPELAAGNRVMAFGDYSYYWIADRQGRSFKRLNELYATTGQIGFLASERVDGKLILSEAVKTLDIKAAGK